MTVFVTDRRQVGHTTNLARRGVDPVLTWDRLPRPFAKLLVRYVRRRLSDGIDLKTLDAEVNAWLRRKFVETDLDTRSVRTVPRP